MTFAKTLSAVAIIATALRWIGRLFAASALAPHAGVADMLHAPGRDAGVAVVIDGNRSRRIDVTDMGDDGCIGRRRRERDGAERSQGDRGAHDAGLLGE